MHIAKKHPNTYNLSAKYFLETVDKIKLFCTFVNLNIKKNYGGIIFTTA